MPRDRLPRFAPDLPWVPSLLVAPCLLVATGLLLAAPAAAQTTPASPAAAQPSVPGGPSAAPAKPGSPVVESIVHNDQPTLDVRKPAQARARRDLVRRHVAPRHVARRRAAPSDLERPALAGVELLAPAPLPGEPPHIVVPMPAYPLDALAAALTGPPPPIVCHRTRRVPDLPDPHLYRETTVQCEPDNP